MSDAAHVDEPISIEDYDASWPALFEREQARVRVALGTVVAGIEPFGSTAVPGLASKPIIDILVGVHDLRAAERQVPSLVALGYENFGEIFVAGRIYPRKRGARPHFNVAVTEMGSSFWNTSLAVRNYLRAHRDEAEAYGRIKREIVRRGATLFSTYSREKEPFTAALRARAIAYGARGS